MRWLFLSSILLFCSLFLSFSFAKHHHDNNNNNNQPSTSPHLIGSLSHSAYPYELVRDTPYNVSYDSRSLLINNQRVLLQSGSLHYPRTTPDTFLSLLESFKAAGLNTVQIYIFWNYHELTPGVYDFYTESRNFTLLLDAAKQAGLFVNFRLGPYVCAEWHYGGLPVFLKDESGMVFRTNNDLWKAAMGNWVKKIMTMVEPWLARNGGPIILAQIENEYGNVEGPYGNAGKQYIQWSADFANSLQLDIPWIMCVQDDAPSSVIQTCNGFYCDQWIRGHVNRQPSQPNMWTEDWSGWFQTWGQGKPYRPPQDMAFAVARWIQLGGTFHNYYMFYGGTNFGRTSGGPWIITSYDYNAPLNEYGGRNEPKYSHSSALHHIIQQYAPTLLSVDSIPSTQSLGSNIEATVYGTLGQQGTIIFISNINTGDNINVNFQGHSFSIPGWSTSIIDGQSYNVLYNTATIKTIMIEDPLPSGSHSVSALNNINNNNNNQAQLKIWSINETIIGGGQATLSSTPIEQLLITEDLTDYVYHRIPITLSDQQINNGHITITLDHISDYFYIFIDSKQLYGSRNIGSVTSINLSLSGFTSGTHTLSIVTITQGITNYGEFLETVKVGLLGGVSIDGQSFVPAPNGLQWSNEPYLKGETNQYYINNNLSPAWNEYYSPSIKQPWVWFKVLIPPPSSLVHPNGFGLDLSGMGKGSFYVNGHHGGRYWNIKASGNCPSTPDHCDYRGAYSDSKCRYGCGDYSQQYYRVPTAWIKETAMSGYVELVFFEEQGGDPNTIQWKAF